MRHLPNLISLARIALAPVCAMALVENDYRRALTVFFIAGWTDFFDGYLARRFAWNSGTGLWLDPLADKVLMAATFIALGLVQAIPLWLVAVVFGRDLLILAGAAIVSARTGIRKFPPTMAGKVSTTIQLGAAFLVMASLWAGWPPWVREIAVWTTAAGTIYSGAGYLMLGWRMMSAAR